MIFILATTIRNVVDYFFRERPGKFTICRDMMMRWMLYRVRVMDDKLELDGSDGFCDEMYEAMDRLDLNEGMKVRLLS